MKTIQLPKSTEIEIIIKESVKITTDKIQLQQTIDNNESVKAVIIADNKVTVLTLWEGQSYKDIGQWTDSDVEKKVIELLSK